MPGKRLTVHVDFKFPIIRLHSQEAALNDQLHCGSLQDCTIPDRKLLFGTLVSWRE